MPKLHTNKCCAQFNLSKDKKDYQNCCVCYIVYNPQLKCELSDTLQFQYIVRDCPVVLSRVIDRSMQTDPLFRENVDHVGVTSRLTQGRRWHHYRPHVRSAYAGISVTRGHFVIFASHDKHVVPMGPGEIWLGGVFCAPVGSGPIGISPQLSGVRKPKSLCLTLIA